MNTNLECSTCGEEDDSICPCNEYAAPVFYIKLTFVNPSKWVDPAPFYYSEDEGGVVTFETWEAAESFARILFGKNQEVTAQVMRSN